jgi:PAS domain-containing protein
MITSTRTTANEIAQAIQEAKQNHALFSEEFRIVPQDQGTHWLVSRGKFLYGKNGEAKRMIGLAADITESKRSRNSGESEERRQANHCILRPS